MFTQCTNCQAIFSVNMREVTVSKGFLRCGECHIIFDSSKNISTTMQAPFVAVDIKELSEENLQTLSSLDDWQSSSAAISKEEQINLRQSPTKTPISNEGQTSGSEVKTKSTQKTASGNASKINNKKTLKGKWPFVAALLLGLLLVFQVAYNYRHLFIDTLKYQPEKIQMLNHNVFAHPIEKDVLLISASIENTAEFDQSFPILEVRLTNSKAELVALRRFSPEEYLDNYSANTLLVKKRATSIKLKIKDPGNQATRFQFDFL
ncbi:MAG: zinc-ribbon and DUF3426 domain-containing protein [Cocleimonas sp.]